MVTEKMIEAACKAVIEKRGYVWPDGFSDEEKSVGRENMRAALEAALCDYQERVHYAEGVADLAMKHRDEAEAALSTDAEPVATIIAERDALIAAGLKCCNGTPNPNLRPFDLAMSFIDSTNTARKGADMLWQQYKAELDAIRAAPSVAVKALQDDRRMIISHATMGRTDGEGQSVNDVCVTITKLRNELYAEAQKPALSAQVLDVP